MFQNPRYITRGIADELHPALYGTLWTFIDAMPTEIEKDYLQVFKITSEDTGTVVTHSQEVPTLQPVLPFQCRFRLYRDGLRHRRRRPLHNAAGH